MAFYPFFRGMDDKPSLFSSHYSVRNGIAPITPKQRNYFSNITWLGKFLVDFDLRLDHRKLLELDAFSSRE